LAKASHTARPSTVPRGIPTTTPTGAIAVACQAKVATIWLLTKPSALSSPISRRRRDTLTTSRWTSVAAPDTANIPPKMSGKLTASPKFTREVGIMGRAVMERYAAK
jgi:hypothetical protein